MPKKIFISYRRTDARAEARSIYVRLTEHFGADRVFFDASGIGKGVNFVETLNEELANTGVLLLILGPDFAATADEHGNKRLESASDYVRVELETALARQIPIIPVLVSDARVPAARDLPQSLQPIVGFNGTVITHSNFQSDSAALIASVEALVGSPPLSQRLGRAVLNGMAALNRSPAGLRLAVYAALLLIAAQLMIPNLLQNTIAFAGSFARVAANADRIPLSTQARADVRQILASTEDQSCPSFASADIWFGPQSYVACGAPAGQFEEFRDFTMKQLNLDCMCWRFENKELTHLFFWIFEGHSRNGAQVDARLVSRLLRAQRPDGYWPTHLDDAQQDERQPLYITAMMVIALTHQEPLVTDPSLKRAVNRAIRRGAGWLAQLEPVRPEDWGDYANNPNAIRHRLFGGMAITAVAPVLSEPQTTAIARRWADDLRFDQASLFLSSDVRHFFADGHSFGDTYRHVPLTWELCGAAAAWPNLSRATRASLLVRLEDRLRATAGNAQSFGRSWVQVDTSYCLREIDARAAHLHEEL